MTYKVEKNIPIPAVRHGGGRPATYPFAELKEPGDSFFIPAADITPKRVQQAAAAYGRRHDISLTIRRVDGGVRVWLK